MADQWDRVPCAARCGATVRAEARWDRSLVTCGALLCRATVEWTPERWAGAALMADARRALGLPLTDVDRVALGRVG